jgi:hypothetical protein
MCSIAIWGNISGRGEIDPLRKQLSQNLRQLVHMFYADFAYYFDLAVHFLVLRHHPKLFPLNPLPKNHKNTYTLLQMYKKIQDLAGSV